MPVKAEKTAKPKKAWKGEKRGGPAPARHIPWPEVFKHHISVVEGHTKMLEMVQKHTVEGTGNYETITNLVKRGHEMLWQAKDISRSFVPPKNQREQIPLGSSSASSYPGYSPADIKYGEAAQEAGEVLSKTKGWQPASGLEYKLGQAHGAKRKMLYQKYEKDAASGEAKTQVEPTQSATDESEGNKNEETGEGLGFIIDTNPTPVVITKDKKSKKRALDDEGDSLGKKKKSKKDNVIEVETEDISAEVDARLKAREEKAKNKSEKRRRESAGDEEKVTKKSKKDRSKKRDVESGEDGSGDGEGKKKRKKSKDAE